MAIEHDLPEFGEVAAILRKGPSDVVYETPPDTLWAAIESSLDEGGGGARADVVDIAARRRGRLRIATAVAAIAAVLLVGVPLTLSLWGSSSPETVELAALPGYEGFGGKAELDGRDLAVDLTGAEPKQGEFYEVWLLDIEGGELRDLVALGTIDASGHYKISQSVDLSRYNTVDVSVEPDDGNPAHSGVSVVRGELPLA
ncbi:MAG: anti-sigma factor [Acidimicrobiales bacterium]